MNTIINGSALNKAARAVKGIAGRGSYMPVLDMVRIKGIREGLEISGTNLETWISYTIACDDTADGSQVFIDAARLLGAVKGRKGSQSVGINAGILQIGALSIEDSPDIAMDYPLQAEYSNPVHVASIAGAEFKAMIKRHRATSKKLGDTTRINLCGVNVEYHPDLLGSTWTTTDGYSLTCEEVDGRPYGDELKKALIPMEYLVKAAAATSPKDTVEIDVLQSTAGEVARVQIWNISGSCIEYTIRTTDEQFPDFRRVIPETSKSLVRFDVDPAELGRIVSEAVITAPEDSGAITLEVIPAGSDDDLASPTHDRLKVSSTSRAGSYESSIECAIRGFASDALQPVSFNAKYLQAIAGFTSDLMLVSLQGPLQAARFDYDRVQTAVLMPVNLTRS